MNNFWKLEINVHNAFINGKKLSIHKFRFRWYSFYYFQGVEKR
jgi:hypothetical protein